MWHLKLLLLLSTAAVPCHRAAADSGGKWDTLLPNIGISAMHMQLLNNNRVIIFDRTDFGLSNISLPDQKCRVYKIKSQVRKDCTAHSVEYDVVSNSVRPLFVNTNLWCSSGAVMQDGQLVQTGGFDYNSSEDGASAVRVFKPCNGCDWEEIMSALIDGRWYATNHILPDGRQIIIGGRRKFNYEFYPKTSSTGSYYLPLLKDTSEKRAENNLYPFVFLNVDGNLFIFASTQSILFDYKNNVIVKTFPEIPDRNPRNYPSTGSAVLLPLKNLQAQNIEVEVMICGGAPRGAFVYARFKGTFLPALDTCAGIKITDPNPQWFMEKMPLARVMGDMFLLPNGKVLIINGAATGCAGWEFGRDPVLNPVIYSPDNQVGSRFVIQNPTKTPRMYHSTAILLGDGRILVGGSNPHDKYMFTGVLYPTELSLDSFSPSYLDQECDYLRPTIITPITQTKIGYGQDIRVRFSVPSEVNSDSVKVTMVAPSFNTHSFSMNQRLLVLDNVDFKPIGLNKYQIRVITPGSGNLAPSGFYMLFVVHEDIPSQAIWVQIQ